MEKKEGFFARLGNFFRKLTGTVRDFIVDHLPRRREKVHRIDAYINERREPAWEKERESREKDAKEKEPEMKDRSPEQPKGRPDPQFDFDEQSFREAMREEMERILADKDAIGPVSEDIKNKVDELYNKCLNSGDQTLVFSNGYSILFKQIATNFDDDPTKCDIFLLNEKGEIENSLFSEAVDKTDMNIVYSIYEKMLQFEQAASQDERFSPEDLFNDCKDIAFNNEEGLFVADLLNGNKLLFEKYTEPGKTEPDVKVSLFNKDNEFEKVLYYAPDGLTDKKAVYDYFEFTPADQHSKLNPENETGSNYLDEFIKLRQEIIDAPELERSFRLSNGSTVLFKEHVRPDGDEYRHHCDVYLLDNKGENVMDLYLPEEGIGSPELAMKYLHEELVYEAPEVAQTIEPTIDKSEELKLLEKYSTDLEDNVNPEFLAAINPDATWTADDYYHYCRVKAMNEPKGKVYFELSNGNALLFEKLDDPTFRSFLRVQMVDSERKPMVTLYSDFLGDSKTITDIINREIGGDTVPEAVSNDKAPETVSNDTIPEAAPNATAPENASNTTVPETASNDIAIDSLNKLANRLKANDGYDINADGTITFRREEIQNRNEEAVEVYSHVTFDKEGNISDMNGYFNKKALEAARAQIASDVNIKDYIKKEVSKFENHENDNNKPTPAVEETPAAKDAVAGDKEKEPVAEDIIDYMVTHVNPEFFNKVQPDATWSADDLYHYYRLKTMNDPEGKAYLELSNGNMLLFEKQDLIIGTDCAVHLCDSNKVIKDTVYNIMEGKSDDKAVIGLINGEITVPTEDEYKKNVEEIFAEKDNNFKLHLPDGRTVLFEKIVTEKQNVYLLDADGNLEKPLYVPDKNIGTQDDVINCLHGTPDAEVSKAEALFNQHLMNVIRTNSYSEMHLPNGKSLTFSPIGRNTKDEMMFDCNVRLMDEEGYIERRLYQPVEGIGSKENVLKLIEESFNLIAERGSEQNGREDLETPREKVIADAVKSEVQQPQNELIDSVIEKAMKTQEDQIISLPNGKILKFEPDLVSKGDETHESIAVFLLNEKNEYEKLLYKEKLDMDSAEFKFDIVGNKDDVYDAYVTAGHTQTLDETINEKRQEVIDENLAADPADKNKQYRDETMIA